MVKIKTCRDLITLCEKTQNPVTTVMEKRESTQEQDLTSHQKRFRDIRIRSKLPETHKFLVHNFATFIVTASIVTASKRLCMHT